MNKDKEIAMCIFDIFVFFSTSYPVMLARHKKTVALPLCLHKVCAITPGRKA